MDDKKEKLVLDGNAFYELDMECLKNKQKKLQREKERNAEKDRQRQRKWITGLMMNILLSGKG